MKRILCITMTGLLLISMLGCAVKDVNGVRENLDTAAQNIKSSQEVIDKVNAIIDWQITKSGQMMEKEKEALKTDGQIDNSDASSNYQEVVTKYEELKEYRQQIESWSEEANNFEETGNEQVDTTYVAAKEYFNGLKTAMNDLGSIFDYYFAEYDAVLPLNTFDATAYTDNSMRLSDLYDTITTVVNNLNGIDCPDYMKETFALLLRQYDRYQALLASMYQGVQLGDPLRIDAAQNMIVTEDERTYEYGFELTDDFNLQFGKVRDRLEGRITTLGGELLQNIQALSDAL